MKRTTFFADEALMNELRELAHQEGTSLASLVREATVQYVRARRKNKARLSFIGVGESGRVDVAEKHEKLLWPKSRK